MAGSGDMSPATAHGAEVLPGLGATRAVGADAHLASSTVSRRGLPCITLKHLAACSSPAHPALLRNLPLLACYLLCRRTSVVRRPQRQRSCSGATWSWSGSCSLHKRPCWNGRRCWRSERCASSSCRPGGKLLGGAGTGRCRAPLGQHAAAGQVRVGGWAGVLRWLVIGVATGRGRGAACASALFGARRSTAHRRLCSSCPAAEATTARGSQQGGAHTSSPNLLCRNELLERRVSLPEVQDLQMQTEGVAALSAGIQAPSLQSPGVQVRSAAWNVGLGVRMCVHHAGAAALRC